MPRLLLQEIQENSEINFLFLRKIIFQGKKKKPSVGINNKSEMLQGKGAIGRCLWEAAFMQKPPTPHLLIVQPLSPAAITCSIYSVLGFAFGGI